MPRPLEGFPTSHGNTRVSVWGHAGPASYTPVTATAGIVPCTGGDVVGVAESGLKFFDMLFAQQSDDAAFICVAIPITPSAPASNLSSALSGIPSVTYRLRWISQVTATVGGQVQAANTEAVAGTNLSAEVVRLMAFGPK